MKRRDFLMTGLGLVGAGAAAMRGAHSQKASASIPDTSSRISPVFGISLAEWSLHRALRAGEVDHLDFALKAHRDFGIEAVEYVNQFFKDRAKDKQYLAEMKERAEGEGVRSLLIMCDGEGNIGSRDDTVRQSAVENHFKWVEAASFLGCHSIRVNALVNTEALPYDEQLKFSAMGLRALSEFSDPYGINVIVENHGNVSSNGAWLAAVMKEVDHPRCGTLPDFGNFCIKSSPTPGGGCQEEYDKYKGVAELMPYAKAVSAKTFAFDAEGNESGIDFERMLRIVLDAGYRGFLGIEYEGDGLPEMDGIRATKALLERLRTKLGDRYSKS